MAFPIKTPAELERERVRGENLGTLVGVIAALIYIILINLRYFGVIGK
jgi:hypothetical protein